MENGVIRIGRKGIKKFAFGEDGEVFSVDVVVAFQEWIRIDEEFRERSEDHTVLLGDMVDYHRAAVEFAGGLAANAHGDRPKITTAEALDFIARLREQYDELVDFFRPKSREEPDSHGTSGVELQFSTE